MTEIIFDRPVTGRYRLRAKGHAAGSPEACAAVSAIVYALGGYLLNLDAAGEAEVHGMRLYSGDAEIDAGPGETGAGAVKVAFEMAQVGLMQVEKAQPDRVRVKISENFCNL